MVKLQNLKQSLTGNGRNVPHGCDRFKDIMKIKEIKNKYKKKNKIAMEAELERNRSLPGRAREVKIIETLIVEEEKT